jgi:hypothetical protein
MARVRPHRRRDRLAAARVEPLKDEKRLIENRR